MTEPFEEDAPKPAAGGRWRHWMEALRARATAGKHALSRLLHAAKKDSAASEAAADTATSDEQADEAEADSGSGRPGGIKPLALYGGIAVGAAAVGAAMAYAGFSARLETHAAKAQALGTALESTQRALQDAEKRFLEQQLELVKTQKEVARLRLAVPPTGTAVALHSENEALVAESPPPPPAVSAADVGSVPSPPAARTDPAAPVPSPAPGGECVLGTGRIAEDLKECVRFFNRTQQGSNGH